MAKNRKQLNIGLEPEDFIRLKAAAEVEHITVTAFARRAVLDALDPPDLPEGQGYGGLPLAEACWATGAE